MSTFTIEECKRWLSSPFINPRTGEKLDNLSKNGIFGTLQKQSQAYNLIKETKTQTKSQVTEILAKEVLKIPRPLIKPLLSNAVPNQVQDQKRDSYMDNVDKPRVIMPIVRPNNDQKGSIKPVLPLPTPVLPLPAFKKVKEDGHNKAKEDGHNKAKEDDYNKVTEDEKLSKGSLNARPISKSIPKLPKRPIIDQGFGIGNSGESNSSVQESSGKDSMKKQLIPVKIEKRIKVENEEDQKYDTTLAARNYIKILESETYIEDFHADEDPCDSNSSEKDGKKESSSEEIKEAEQTRRRGRPPKPLKQLEDSVEPDNATGNSALVTRNAIKPRLIKKNKRVRYYMYVGICEDPLNLHYNGVIPIINSNWVELVETLGKEIYLLESLNKHRISIIEVISDKIDFRDFVRMPEIIKAEQVARSTGTISEYDYLSETYYIPSLSAYIGERTYDTQESRMLLEFLTTLEDVMVDLGNVVLDVEKKPKSKKKAKNIQQENGNIEENHEDEVREEIDIMKPDLDPGSLTISQLIKRVDRFLKPLLTERINWEEKYAEYYVDDDWFYIDFYKMVEDLSVKDFKELVQRTYKKRIPDTWLTEQYRDTEDIEEFLAHLEVTIDELYGSDIAQEGSDDYENRLANIITEFTRIKKA